MNSKRDLIDGVITIAFLVFVCVESITHNLSGSIATVVEVGFPSILAYWFTKYTPGNTLPPANVTPQVQEVKQNENSVPGNNSNQI